MTTSTDPDSYHVELVKELTLKFSIAQMRTWFLGGWRERYAEELDNAMLSIGRPEGLCEEDHDEIEGLFVPLDAIYCVFKTLVDPDLVLDHAIEAWLSYLAARSAPKGTSDYVWYSIEEDYGEVFEIINQQLTQPKIHTPTGKPMKVRGSNDIPKLRNSLRDHIPLGFLQKDLQVLGRGDNAAAVRLYYCNDETYGLINELFAQPDDLWLSHRFVNAITRLYGPRIRSFTIEYAFEEE